MSLPTPRKPVAENEHFEKPVRLSAGGQLVSVAAPGYACPTMADVDGDGVDDLVVGQFREGMMKVYRNVAAADAMPEFSSGDFIKHGDEPVSVPGVW